MQTEILDILLDRLLSHEEVNTLLKSELPDYDNADISSKESKLKDVLMYSINGSEDNIRWVCQLTIYNFPKLKKYGGFSEIYLAKKIYNLFKINSVISVNELISELDPEDPFWCLAYINGSWYFGDTSDSIFMGCKSEQAIENQPKPISVLNFEEPKKYLFKYKELSQNGF